MPKGRRLVLQGEALVAHERIEKEHKRQAEQIEEYQTVFTDMAEERSKLAEEASAGAEAIQELADMQELHRLPGPLRRFFSVMVHAYKKNLPKGGPPAWSGLTVHQGLEKVEEEHREFIQAIADKEEPDRVVDEAADVALSSMITAHVYATEHKADRA